LIAAALLSSLRNSLLQRFANLDHLLVEINAAPAKCRYLTKARAGEQRDHGHRAEPPVAKLLHQVRHVLHDRRVRVGDLGRAFVGGDVAVDSSFFVASRSALERAR
jgi:hypothetical protein